MKRQKKIDPPTKFDEKIGKRALAFLKKKAIECASTGIGRNAYDTGVILGSLGIHHGYDNRDAMYRGMIRFLNHCVDLGLIKESNWGSPKKFAYAGPEVKKAEAAFNKTKEARKKKMVSDLRKLGIRKPSITDHFKSSYTKGGFSTSITDEQVARLVARL